MVLRRVPISLGVGKTHLAQALGQEWYNLAAKRWYIFAANEWYITGCKLTLDGVYVTWLELRADPTTLSVLSCLEGRFASIDLPSYGYAWR